VTVVGTPVAGSRAEDTMHVSDSDTMTARATAPTPGSVTLELISISHRWRKRPLPVLDDVTLRLTAGTVVWIGGRNGVGKTTLMRVAAGILLPQQGTVRMGELDPVRDRRAFHNQLGFVSAGDRGLNARMKVTQQLDFWARLSYVPHTRRSAVVAAAIEHFGLQELATARVDRISMGQRQRVRLAMAFLHEPGVILLDEPRNSLDDEGYAVLSEAVAAAAARGAAVVWCSPRGEDRVLSFDESYSLLEGRLERVE
jgi:ABC-type multidrug transport system ATPase subunit